MSGQASAWRTGLAATVVAASVVAGAHASENSSRRADIVVQALSLLGTPYRYGGTSPASGLDCSGLVRHVFASTLDRELPRRAEEISTVGQPISRAELEPGDLVFFNTLRRAFSHVAIYIGDGRFIHAPARAGRVRIEALDDRYWAARFNGARRVLRDAPPATAGDSSQTAGPVANLPVPLFAGMPSDRPPEP